MNVNETLNKFLRVIFVKKEGRCKGTPECSQYMIRCCRRMSQFCEYGALSVNFPPKNN
jgi:hypothetical protein